MEPLTAITHGPLNVDLWTRNESNDIEMSKTALAMVVLFQVD
jgi:hypothetical protein